MNIKNIICYTVGVLCVLASIALLIFGRVDLDGRAITLVAVFLLGFIGVIAMDLVDFKEEENND